MDPVLPNPLIDLHQQKKQRKRQQLQRQQQQFLYHQQHPHPQPSSVAVAHFNNGSSPPLPSLTYLMHNGNKHQMPLKVMDQIPKHAQMKQQLDLNRNGTNDITSISSGSNINNKVSYTNMNSSPVPTQMYHASMSQQQSPPPQQQQPLIQTKTNTEMDNNSLTFYQRSVVNIYQQPPAPVDSSFYPIISRPQATDDGRADDDDNLQSDVPTATPQQQQQPLAEEQQKIYSFVPLDVIFQQKRPRKKFNEVERLYACTYLDCTKAYGTLNHLNAHVTMQGHGPKRMPIEFKELRRQLKSNRKKLQPPKPRKNSNTSQKQQKQKQQHQQQQQQQQQSRLETGMMVNDQSDLLQQHPPSEFYMNTASREHHEHDNLVLNHHHHQQVPLPQQPQPQPQQEFNLYGPPPSRTPSISAASYPQQHQFGASTTASSSTSSSFSSRYPQYNMMQQHQQQPF